MESISRLDILLVLMSALFLGPTATLACDIDDVAANAASGPIPGGWSRASLDDADINHLKMAAVEGANDVSKGVHVTEAYTQVVAGTNYCIRFSAMGTCSPGHSGHCQSMECVVSGHKPLQGSLTVTNSQCQRINACNFDTVREHAKTPMPGGWSSEDTNDANIDKLNDHASKISAVVKGRVTGAYRQTVRGTNYCIRFESDGSTDSCNADECSPLTCDAGGFLPLSPGNTDKPAPIRNVGVTCRSSLLKGSGPGETDPRNNGVVMTSVMVLVFALVLAAFIAM